jgi:branched-chain amino acid transport system ATP-binding protein
MTPLLALRSVEVNYGGARALSGLDMEVAESTVVAVLGVNGAGKSTLARAITGLVPATRGSIVYAGEDISSWSPPRIRRAGIVHLPEGRGVFPGLSVRDNLRMAVSQVPLKADRAAAIERGYDLFPVLGKRRGQQAGSLSGGEQQMLSLARALTTSPRLIIADEMSLGLAPKMVDVIFESLERARTAGVTIIMVEQFVHRALAFADHCVMLQRGSVAWSGPAGAAKSEVLARYLGEEAAGVA